MKQKESFDYDIVDNLKENDIQSNFAGCDNETIKESDLKHEQFMKTRNLALERLSDEKFRTMIFTRRIEKLYETIDKFRSFIIDKDKSPILNPCYDRTVRDDNGYNCEIESISCEPDSIVVNDKNGYDVTFDFTVSRQTIFGKSITTTPITLMFTFKSDNGIFRIRSIENESNNNALMYNQSTIDVNGYGPRYCKAANCFLVNMLTYEWNKKCKYNSLFGFDETRVFVISELNNDNFPTYLGKKDRGYNLVVFVGENKIKDIDVAAVASIDDFQIYFL
jgi:hypothetical protein